MNPYLDIIEREIRGIESDLDFATKMARVWRRSPAPGSREKAEKFARQARAARENLASQRAARDLELAVRP